MRLRPARNKDTDEIRTLIFETLIEYGLSPDPRGTDADLDDIEANYAKRGGFFEVLENERGRIVGTVGLYPLGDGTCELRKMYLAADVRGLGWGKKLLDRTIDRARAAGCTRIGLETAAVLVEAIGLYRQHGFQPVRGENLSDRCDQAYVLELVRDPPEPKP